jgi:hypothetical protein
MLSICKKVLTALNIFVYVMVDPRLVCRELRRMPLLCAMTSCRRSKNIHPQSSFTYTITGRLCRDNPLNLIPCLCACKHTSMSKCLTTSRGSLDSAADVYVRHRMFHGTVLSIHLRPCFVVRKTMLESQDFSDKLLSYLSTCGLTHLVISYLQPHADLWWFRLDAQLHRRVFALSTTLTARIIGSCITYAQKPPNITT